MKVDKSNWAENSISKNDKKLQKELEKELIELLF